MILTLQIKRLCQKYTSKKERFSTRGQLHVYVLGDKTLTNDYGCTKMLWPVDNGFTIIVTNDWTILKL